MLLRELTATVRLAAQATLRGIHNRYLHLLRHLNTKEYDKRLEYLRKAESAGEVFERDQ